jgi:hypothetical protein
VAANLCLAQSIQHARRAPLQPRRSWVGLCPPRAARRSPPLYPLLDLGAAASANRNRRSADPFGKTCEIEHIGGTYRAPRRFKSSRTASKGIWMMYTKSA